MALEQAIRAGAAAVRSALSLPGIDVNGEVGVGVTPLWMAANARVPLEVLKVRGVLRKHFRG